MKENKIQIKINHYINSLIGTPRELTGGFETKIVRDNHFKLSQLEPQQKTYLLSLLDTSLYWKLSDADPRKKPFDFFVLPAGYSYLCIYFVESKNTYIVLFADIIKNKKKTSFSEKEIEELSVRKIKL